MIPIKPKYNSPCNGCGACCLMVPCALATTYLGVTINDACPALEFEESRYWCGLVRNPAKYLKVGPEAWKEQEMRVQLSPIFAGMLRLGGGCDAQDGLFDTGTDVALAKKE